MELKMYRSETPSKPIEDDGAWAVLFADLEEWPVLSAQSRQSGFGLPGHVCRGWTLSTVANDAERERVCEQDCPCSVIHTT